MATYKVIQDIEAEDHILGPLTLRQFIYGLITVLFLYLSFVVVVKHVPFLLALFVPPALFFGFLAFPFKQDQPTEVWALARIRFIFKPRRRVWDQSGIKELVTITVPKKIEAVLTNGLNQNEVKSRLHALADTIDSRGWAIKNVNVNLTTQTNDFSSDDSDRLLGINDSPQAVPDYDVQASDDILDEKSNPIAQHMDQMISASTQAHRKHIVDELNEIRDGNITVPVQAQPPAADPSANYWFLEQPVAPTNTMSPPAVFAPSQPLNNSTAQPPITNKSHVITTSDEQALLEHIKIENDSQHESYAHLHTLQPLGDNNQSPAATTTTNDAQEQASSSQVNPSIPPVAAVTPPTDTAILSLANNNDLNVATLAREASKAKNSDRPPQDEVVISLH